MLQKEGKHHSVLVKRLAQEAGCKPEDIVDFELNVCDTQPGVIGGVLRQSAGLVQATFTCAGHLCTFDVGCLSLEGLCYTRQPQYKIQLGDKPSIRPWQWASK